MMKTRLFRRLSTVCLLAVLMVLLTMVLGTAAADAYGAETSVSRYTGKTYTHNSAFANAIIVDGVDVSYVQKNNVDWEKAKADGVDFAIIRVGARGYGQSGKLLVDDYYRENIEAAQDAGLMVGVYFFSQAIDPVEAYAEAAYTLELIEGYDLDLPVFMDYEFASDKNNPGRLNTAQLSKIKMTENAEMFLETIEAGGYEAGFYANRNFLNKTVNGKSIGERWPVWVAQYNTDTDYTGQYEMWQYSSSGYVDGYGGRLDVNFMYLDAEPEAEGYLSLADSTITITGRSDFEYESGRIHEPQIRVRHFGSTLYEGIDYKTFYLKNANAGTGYVLIKGIGSYTDYKLEPFTIEPSSDVYGFTVDPIGDMSYTGKPCVPASITVKDGYGNTLVNGLDYTFTVDDNVNAGKAEVTIELQGNYTGKLRAYFNILQGSHSIKVEKNVYDVTAYSEPFQLEGITADKDVVLTFTSSDTSVAEVSTSGEVIPGAPGTAVITITAAGDKNYTETSVTVTVNVSKEEQVIYVNADSYSKTRLAKAFYLGGVSNAGADVSYESLNPSVVKVNSSGKVTLMGSGTADILITAPETETHLAAEKLVTVKVKEMNEEEFTEKYENLKTGIESTKIVSVKAYPERKKVKLTWKKSNSGYALEYYQVWRSVKKSSGYAKIYTTSTDSKKYYVNSKGLQPGKTYWYKVRGVRNLEGKLVYTPFTKIKVTTKE